MKEPNERISEIGVKMAPILGTGNVAALASKSNMAALFSKVQCY